MLELEYVDSWCKVVSRFHPVSPFYRQEMWDLIAEKCPEPRVVVEIGALFGNWTVGVLSRFNVGWFFSVDPWGVYSYHENDYEDIAKDDNIMKIWMKNVEPWLWKKVFPLRGFSEHWAKVFPYKIDLLYIDGNHSMVMAGIDLRGWVPLVRDGGLLIMHDFDKSSVRKAYKRFFGHKSWNRFCAGPKENISVSCWKIIRRREDGKGYCV